MATIYGATKGGYWRTYLSYSTSTTNTQVTVTATVGLYTYAGKWIKSGTRKATLSATGQTTSTKSKSNTKESGSTYYAYVTRTYTYTRGTTASTKTISGSITYTGSDHNGTSSCSVSITIPALPMYTVQFDANGGTNAPANISQFINYNATVPSATPVWNNSQGITEFTFLGWTKTKYQPLESSDTIPSVDFYPSGTYNDSVSTVSTRTLYALWVRAREYPEATIGTPQISGKKLNGVPLRYYSKYSVGYTVTHKDSQASSVTVTLELTDNYGNSATQTATGQSVGASGTLEIDNLSLTGKVTAVIKLYDGLITKPITLKTFTLAEPTWNLKCRTEDEQTGFAIEDTPPDKDSKQKGIVDIQAEVYNNGWTGTYESLGTSWDFVTYEYEDNGETKTGWTLPMADGKSPISLSSRYTDGVGETPNMRLKVVYTTTVSKEKEYRTAFYTTSRNANYHTGLANNIFVGSVDSIAYPNYASRVWYSSANDPLYFPDLNYIEVGSNDTNIMGMVKVGEYLGIIKQSKATDTSIYLAYATSFDDETTFATKQSVSGVGAIGKRCFNVLGDETLFFSPDGVMAIVPSEDDQHRVQLRSYYLNKKLLAENSPETSYSIVYDGKYILAVNDHCYVLDGNQKTSWETAKTDLQYEAYYWENVPARFFMLNGDELWFATQTEICRMKDADSLEPYQDAYDVETGEENVPVKAEWSTILDDDGSIHYYKTMQKKGNVVSILPIDDTVSFRLEEITEEEFNENKTKYYTFDGNDYIQCTEEDEFDGDTNYFVKIESNTSAEVYIKKDAEEPFFVGEVNGLIEETGDIPNELVVRKKVKKYKRLQFIVKNNKSEGLGIGTITKSYVVGNYVK